MSDLTERVSIRDIAKAAETSVSTVSRALNNHPDVSAETRERILQIANACGYERNVFAHSLISGRSGLISVVMPDIDYDYHLQFLRGLAHAAQRFNQELLLTVKGAASETIEACRSIYRRGIADGVIIFAPAAESEGPLVQLQEAGFPVVSFHPAYPLQKLTSVEPMDHEGAMMAVRHLLSLGHRRIGLIVEDPQRLTGHERLRGYADALQQAGMPRDPELVITIPSNQPERSGRAAIRQWIASDIEFTAIFCFNDLVAYGAGKELLSQGLRVPEDVSIVGFDDIPSSIYFGEVGLTTIKQPITRIGELALETLLDLLNDRTIPGQRIQVPVELVIRGTTGPVRGSQP